MRHDCLASPLGLAATCPTVVAIPAKNEAEEIEDCLRALAAQKLVRPDAIVLCLNNCADETARIVGWVERTLPVAIETIEVELPSDRAFAGAARRIAMDRAADLAGPSGVLLTTDADARVPADWLSANLVAVAEGADAIAGQAQIEPEGAKLIPAHLHAIDARECAYAALLDEIKWLLDPDPFDPWPRHDEHSGASIAVTVEAYRRAGGMPVVPLGEDRAFFAALRRADARIRHLLAAPVIVSARTVGRAQGGMADTMRRRMEQVDAFLDNRLEPVCDALRRVRLYRSLRTAWRGQKEDIDALARRLGLRTGDVASWLSSRYFGVVWAKAEARSPVLRRSRVALADLPAQTARAWRVRDALRLGRIIRTVEDPGDTALDAAAA